MAVNDLMMRIQLLVDGGKSSAELNRIQKALADLQKSIQTLGKTKVDPLKEMIQGISAAQKELKTVGIDNYATALQKLGAQFSQLGLSAAKLKTLNDGFRSLEIAKSVRDASNLTTQIKKASLEIEGIKSSAKNGLLFTGSDTPFDVNAWKAYDRVVKGAIKDQNVELETQRDKIRQLNASLKDSAKGYAALRSLQGQSSKTTLDQNLLFSKDLLGLKSKEIENARYNLGLIKDYLKTIQKEGAQLSKKKILDVGVNKNDVNAGAINKAVADYKRLNQQIETQKQLLIDAKKQSGQQFFFDARLEQAKSNLRSYNQELAKQKIILRGLGVDKLRALQTTEAERIAAINLANVRKSETYLKGNQTNYFDTVKKSIVDLNLQIANT